MTVPHRAVPSPAALWAGHEAARHAWAFRAYDRFVESLSPEVRGRLAHKDERSEAYVVVFGKTQVGKTTLLIELMGVLPQQLARVSRVLRGGRATGRSATATAMEYRRSADHRWGLKTDSQATAWFDDDAGITTALGQLRSHMESGEFVSHAPSVVSLPRECFHPDAVQPAVRMLDLPGDKPANPVEQEHVNAMARTYVPLADLILLVGKGEDLTFLEDGALTLPGIEDWQTAPRRFRIITTYSFATQTLRDMVRQHDGEADAAFYRQRLISEIGRAIALSAEARQPELFFPLEFGRSWRDTEKLQPELYERLSPMLERLKQQLLDDIHASTTPLARLRAAVDAHIVIAKVKERRVDEFNKAGATLHIRLQEHRDELASAVKAAEQAARDCKRLNDQLSSVSRQRMIADLEKYLVVPEIAEQNAPETRVADFKVCIEQRRSACLHSAATSRFSGMGESDTAWFWRSVKLELNTERLNAALSEVFADLLAVLNAYVLDRYWKTGTDSDYQRDRQALAVRTERARATCALKLREMWLDAGVDKLAEYHGQLRLLRVKEGTWRQLVAEIRPVLEAAEAKSAEHERERNMFLHRMETDLLESQRFASLLDDGYLAELRQRKASIAGAAPVPAFLGLLAAVELARSRQQVLHHVDSVAN